MSYRLVSIGLDKTVNSLYNKHIDSDVAESITHRKTIWQN